METDKAPPLVRAINFIIDRIVPVLRPLSLLLYFLGRLAAMSRTGFYLVHNDVLKMRLGQCGNGVRLNGRIKVTDSRGLRLGDNVHVNDGAYLRTEGGLSIGDNVHISRNLTVYTRNHRYQGDLLPYDHINTARPVTIGDNVWIGMNVNIAPGVEVGEGSIIGMGVTLTRSVPPLSIVVADSALIIKQRDEEHYRRLCASKSFSGMSGFPVSRKP